MLGGEIDKGIRIIDKGDVIARKIEVDTSSFDKSPTALISTPVYHKEWENGNFIRHIKSHLGQRLEESESIELNYILNLNRNINSNIVDAERSTDKIRRVLKELVEVQKIQNRIKQEEKEVDKSDNLARNERLALDRDLLNKLINAESDSQVRELLKMACSRTQQVSFSYIDISTLDTEEFGVLGYPGGDSIKGSMRTFGSDYARKRLKQSPESIFQISDIDTLPSSNNLYQSLINYYRGHPDVPFYFSSLNYQLPGDNSVLFTRSPSSTLDWMFNYNIFRNHGSPQISCRASLLSDDALDSIRSINSSPTGQNIGIESPFEDFATAIRLLSSSESSIQGDYPYGSFLTLDRPEGFEDGVTDRFKFNDEVYTRNFESERSKLLMRIDDLPQAEKITVESELRKIREKYMGEVKKMRRFYLKGLHEFLSAIDSGLISFDQGSLKYNPEDINSESLKIYLSKHKNFVGELTTEDIEWLKFLCGRREASPIEIPNKKQKAMRSFFGTYISWEKIEKEKQKESERNDEVNESNNTKVVEELGDINYKKEEINSDYNNYNVKISEDPFDYNENQAQRPLETNEKLGENKESLFYGMIAEILSLGEVYRRYFEQSDLWESIRSINPEANPETITTQIKNYYPFPAYNIRTRWLSSVNT